MLCYKLTLGILTRSGLQVASFSYLSAKYFRSEKKSSNQYQFLTFVSGKREDGQTAKKRTQKCQYFSLKQLRVNGFTVRKRLTAVS